MAELFKEVICTTYKNAFKHIIFAIYDDQNTGKDHNPLGNVISFTEVFVGTETK